jgi:hypothetical protein
MFNFEAIKKIPLAKVVERYAGSLKGEGEWLQGKCPLPSHDTSKSNTAFSVNIPKNFWRCFSAACNAANGGKKGGDVINFVALMEGCNAKEAAQKLAEWFGIDQASKTVKVAQQVPERPTVASKVEMRPEKHSTKGESAAAEPKPSHYMQEVDLWFDVTFNRLAGESDDMYWKRVRNSVKSKLIESFRSGKAQQAA